MYTIDEIIHDKITLDIDCVDRVYLNGYVPALQFEGNVVLFIHHQFNWPIASPKALYQMTDAFNTGVKEFAKQQGLEIYDFKKDEDKDEIARQHAERLGLTEGVVLIGKAQEKTSAFGANRDKQQDKVWFKYYRRTVNVNHYYFYIMDKDFGLVFIKVCTYLPFEVKVCFNGHEWAKQQLRQEGVAFEPLSNGFAGCENPERLQQICDQLDHRKIQALFDKWVEQLPWPLTLKQRAAGYQHHLSIWQMEVSRTQVFRDPEQGRALVENLIRDTLDLGRPDRVSLIFDRKITKRTPSEFHTRVLREGVLPSIRIRYKHSALKQYFKDGRGLRTEAMFNNLGDFGSPRGLIHFDHFFKLGREINQRLLEQERISWDCFVPLEEIRQVGQSIVLENGQRASALHFGEKRVMALFAAIVRHAGIAGPLRNKSLRQAVAQLMGISETDYTASQMSYDLRRLRLKGVIERVHKSHVYRLTEFGAKLAVFFVKLYERLFRPGLSALAPNQIFPSELAQALNQVAETIEAWTNKAFIPQIVV